MDAKLGIFDKLTKGVVETKNNLTKREKKND